MDPRAPPPLGMVAPPHLRPPDPPHRLLLRPTSFLEQQPSIKGEYIEDLEGIKFEPAEPPRSPEHVSRQQFLKQFPLISVRPPSPVQLRIPASCRPGPGDRGPRRRHRSKSSMRLCGGRR